MTDLRLPQMGVEFPSRYLSHISQNGFRITHIEISNEASANDDLSELLWQSTCDLERVLSIVADNKNAKSFFVTDREYQIRDIALSGRCKGAELDFGIEPTLPTIATLFQIYYKSLSNLEILNLDLHLLTIRTSNNCKALLGIARDRTTVFRHTAPTSSA
ncbi:hypothetical protein J6590_083501 [Homalodisca vitripennis]|nr:hypothetical protein J6590_083501 [Homalodisca vitripennis]